MWLVKCKLIQIILTVTSMMKKIKMIYNQFPRLAFLLLMFGALAACNHRADTNSSDETMEQENVDYSDVSEDVESSNDYDTSYSEDDDGSTKIEDGTYSATVDYNNPETGFSNTYTLDVDVEDGEVVQINFPNDGYLDDDHIIPAEVEGDGHCTVEGEDGKTYDIQIDL